MVLFASTRAVVVEVSGALAEAVAAPTCASAAVFSAVEVVSATATSARPSFMSLFKNGKPAASDEVKEVATPSCLRLGVVPPWWPWTSEQCTQGV